MANVDRPYGFKPVKHLTGGEIRTRRYKKEASTIIGIGDAVLITGSSEADTAIPLVDRASAGSGTITGIVVAIDPQRGDLSKNYLAAADSGYLLVCDDPDVLFSIQDDASGAPAVTDIGEAADIAVANADTNTGRSNMEINGSDIGTGDQVQLMELIQREDNELGDNAEWLVRINEHSYRPVAAPI